MTDAELSTWHARLREHQLHVTLVSHLKSNAGGGSSDNSKAKAKSKEPDVKVDISEYE